MREFSRSCAVALALGVVSIPAEAQTTVVGTVADSTGLPIAGVVVSIAAESISGVSDGAGRFALEAVARGTHIVGFRRLGVRPHELSFTVPATAGAEWNLGTIVLGAQPVDLPTIVAQEDAPTMSARGMREFEQALRIGHGYFFTAADIERLRPFDVSDVIRRVPGGLRREDPTWGTHIEFLTRGVTCTATIRIDGIATSNPIPDVFLTPERVGGIWANPATCTVDVWTKPMAAEDASPFEIGLHLGGEISRGSPGLSLIGGFIAMPVSEGHFDFYPAFHVSASRLRSDITWRAQLALRFRPLGMETPWYLGGGVTLEKPRVNTGEIDTSPLLLGGVSLRVGPLRPFTEFHVLDLVTRGGIRTFLFTGISLRQ